MASKAGALAGLLARLRSLPWRLGLAAMLALAFISVGFALHLGGASLVQEAAATDVCGVQSGAITWNNAGSPYYLRNYLTCFPPSVAAGSSITIDLSGGSVAVQSYNGTTNTCPTNGGPPLGINGTLRVATFGTPNTVTFSDGCGGNRWSGLAPSGGILDLTNTTINGGGVNASSSTITFHNVTVQNVADVHAVWASGPSFSWDGGAVTNIGTAPNLVFGTANGVFWFPDTSGTQPFLLNNVSFSNLPMGDAVHFSQAGGSGPISITNNTISGAGGEGINIGPGKTYPKIAGNSIANSGFDSSGPYPAIYMASATVTLAGTGNTVAANTGYGNGMDALYLKGVTVTNSFTWLTALTRTASSTDKTLGYLLDGDLVINGPLTLTVPQNAIVKATFSRIYLNGGTLDASAGGAVFTSLKDATVGGVSCSQVFYLSCVPSNTDWSGIRLTQDLPGNRGNAAFVGATFRWTTPALDVRSGATSTVGSTGFGMTFRGGAISNWSQNAITVQNTAVSITGASIASGSGDGVSISGGTGNLVSGADFSNITGSGLYLSSAGTTVDRSRFTSVGGTTVGKYGIYNYGSNLAVTCSSIHHNAAGLYVGSTTGSTSISGSDLFANTGTGRYDLDDSVPVTATGNWWGQGGGPVAGQISNPAGATVSSSLASQIPTVAAALADTAYAPSGGLGSGTVTVTLTFNRPMDTSVSPVVTINPGAHAVTGAWQSDGLTWVGTYTLNSSSASSGPNTLSISGAQSCVPEPASNVMTATSVGFVVDFSSTATTVTQSSYNLGTQQPDGASTWYEIDPALRTTVTVGSAYAAIVSGNIDLWTAAAGYNQDVGIFMTDCTLANLLAWKESGGFAGTFSPNAALVQTVVSTSGTYTFTLCWKANKVAPAGTIYAAAGTAGTYFSPTTLTVKVIPASYMRTGVASNSYHLDVQQPDGASTWYEIDPALRVAITVPAAGSLLLGGNMDLWTAAAGYNQDLAIFSGSSCANLANLISWKESGGFAGTLSPNAAFVEGVLPVTSGQTYNFTLCWKVNKVAPPGTIYGAAGTAGTYFSPTRLTAEFVPTSSFSSASRVLSYHLDVQQPDGASTWYEVDPGLRVSVTGSAGQKVVLGGNMDLWTAAAGYNQDLGIFRTDCSRANLLAWKESGGFAGTFSPNAAYVQTRYQLATTGTTTFTLCWKANKVAPAGTIYGGAGTSSTYFSPTRLTAELTN